MTTVKVTEIIKEILLTHFSHQFSVWGMMCCYEQVCVKKDCRCCFFRRPQVSKWHLTQVLPEIENQFKRKYTLPVLDFYGVIKFYADD